MNNLDLLKNKGFFRIGNRQTDSEEKTVIVLGLARSGTSIVAGALFHLGIYMGEQAGRPVFEDVHLSSAVESNDDEKIERIIQTYNQSYKIWGYKRPASLKKLSMLHHKCRNPHYIIIFRDVFSIANRNRISVKADILKNMNSSLREYETLLQFLKQKKPNALLVAFEKALNDKKRLIDNLISFCGIKPSPECMEAAQAFIKPDPEDYLESSRITRSIGQITSVTPGCVSGWAKYQNSKRPAKVCLIANNKEIARTTANIDLNKGSHGKVETGKSCGFIFENLPIGWNKGLKEIRVKVEDDIRDLENSPFNLSLSDLRDQGTDEISSEKRPLNHIRTIYLHVGLHKTGTTSLQNALYEDRVLLQKSNIYYPEKWVRNHSLPLYIMFCDQNRRYHYHMCVRKGLNRFQVDKNRKEYREILLEELSSTDFETLLLSGEDVSILKEENLHDLKTVFQSIMPKSQIKIIIFLREPIKLMKSRVQERVKSGQSLADENFFEPQIIEIRKRIEKFYTVFGKENILLHKYEKALEHQHGLVGFFMEMVGVKKKDLSRFKKFKSNASLSDKAVDIISYINSRQTLIENGKITDGRAAGDTIPLQRIRGSEFQLPQEGVVKKIIEQSKDEMEWLKMTTGIDYPVNIHETGSSGKNTYRYGCRPEIRYGDEYLDDIKILYPVLSDRIKEYVYDYMKELESILENPGSKKTVLKIIQWIEAYDIKPNYLKQKMNMIKVKSSGLTMRMKDIKGYLSEKFRCIF